MSVLHLNRCKNCRYWRGEPHHRQCVLRLRKVPTKDGKGTRLEATTDKSQDTIDGPLYGKKTKPRDSCKHFVPKGLPYRKPPPAPPVRVGEFDASEVSAGSPDVNLVDIGL